MGTTQLYKAILRSMLGSYSVYAVNLMSMMLLARIFTPEIYGTVAAIQVFFLFFKIMAEAGLGPAVINLEKLDTIDRNGIFSLTILVGIIFSISFYLLAPAFLVFYEIDRVNEVVPFIAVSLFFFSATILPDALLIREQAFFRIANVGVAAEVISTSFAVLLVNWIDPLYVLSAKSSFIALTNFSLFYYFSGGTEFGRPHLGTKFSAIKPLLSFSLYQFGFNFINYFSRNLDNILVGKFLGSGSLGIYDKAYQLMRYPLLLLTFAMTPAIQPVMKKYRDDIEKVEQIHREFTFKLSLIGALAGISIFVLAEWIVLIALGKQWGQVVPLIQILSLAIPVQVVSSTSGSFFQAMHRADLLFYVGCLSATILVSAISWGVYLKDLFVISWALVIAFHINFIHTYFILYKVIFKKNLARFFKGMIPAIIIVICLATWELSTYNWIQDFLSTKEYVGIMRGYILVIIESITINH